jgi:acyl-CoA reductase-like NAD-dependent aldehyde dehydrogenase
MLIGGRLVDGDHEMDVINPATEEVFATVARASERQADEAIEAAAAAFPGWAETPMAERQAKVSALADAIVANADKLARALTQEQGKHLDEAQGEDE